MLGGCLTELAAVAAVAFECRVLAFVAGLGVGSVVSTAIGLHVGAIPCEEVRPDERIPPQMLPTRLAK